MKRYDKEHEGQNQSWEAGMDFAQAKYSDQPTAQGRGKDDRGFVVPMSAAFSGLVTRTEALGTGERLEHVPRV